VFGPVMADVATRIPTSDEATTPEPVRQRRFTREEYFRMAETGVLGPEDRTELIDGYLVEMTARNAPHRAVIVNGTKLFVDLLRDTDYSVQIQSTLPLDCRNVPEPDFAIFRGNGSDLLDGEPDEIPLIVEVADTTLTYDRTEKLVCYASNDIPEYWIVNLQAQTVECYHDPADDEYRERRTLERRDTVAPRFDDTLELAVADLSPAPAEGGE
jgi:Uma2 family endonuclease